MTLTEISDLKEITNLCGVFLFGMLRNGKFATPWVEADFAKTNALRTSFNKNFNKVKHSTKCVVGQKYRDHEGNYRFYCCGIVPSDGHYNEDQLVALKQAVNRDGSGLARMFPLMDTFGSFFDFLHPEYPNDQPGGIFISGDIPSDVKDMISKIFSSTMFDIFITGPKPSDNKDIQLGADASNTSLTVYQPEE